MKMKKRPIKWTNHDIELLKRLMQGFGEDYTMINFAFNKAANHVRSTGAIKAKAEKLKKG